MKNFKLIQTCHGFLGDEYYCENCGSNLFEGEKEDLETKNICHCQKCKCVYDTISLGLLQMKLS